MRHSYNPKSIAPHESLRGDQAPRSGYLIVAPWRLDAIGGVSTAIRGLFRALLAGHDCRPTLLINDWDPIRLQIGTSAAQPAWFLRIPDPFAAGPIVSQVITLLFRFPYSLLQVNRLLKRERIDVVNIHYPGLACATFLVLRACKWHRLRMVLSFHGLDAHGIHSESNWLRRRVWRLVLRKADAIVGCSERHALEVAVLLGIDAARVHFVNNGVDVTEIERLAACSVSPIVDRPYMVCLTTFEHKKGLDTLIQAFRSVSLAHPEVDLVIAGRREPLLDEIKRLIADLGLSHRVHLMPDLPHGEAMALLSKARLLVLPSRREPFGLVLLEAGALGIPMVFTDVCGAADALPAGLVRKVPPNDPITLGATLSEVLVNPDDAKSRAQELREFVRQHMSWDAAASKYARIAAGA